MMILSIIMGPIFLSAQAGASYGGWDERSVGAGMVTGVHFELGGLQVAEPALA